MPYSAPASASFSNPNRLTLTYLMNNNSLILGLQYSLGSWVLTAHKAWPSVPLSIIRPQPSPTLQRPQSHTGHNTIGCNRTHGNGCEHRLQERDHQNGGCWGQQWPGWRPSQYTPQPPAKPTGSPLLSFSLGLFQPLHMPSPSQKITSYSPRKWEELPYIQENSGHSSLAPR